LGERADARHSEHLATTIACNGVIASLRDVRAANAPHQHGDARALQQSCEPHLRLRLRRDQQRRFHRFELGELATSDLMKKIEEYLKHAEECRAMARNTTNEEQRLGLLTMAETWEGLAKERRAQIDRAKRIDEIEAS
jgi:hypothetical protein